MVTRVVGVEDDGVEALVVAALEDGAVVAVPTDTVYGVAALPAHADRLSELKGRPADMPIAVLCSDGDDVTLAAAGVAVGKVPDAARRLAKAHWPGALTLVLAATAGGAVGVRVPDHDWCRRLLRRTGPLSATSANLHGQPVLHDAQAIANGLGTNIAVVVDGGRLGQQASTVVDCTGPSPVVLRQGSVVVDG